MFECIESPARRQQWISSNRLTLRKIFSISIAKISRTILLETTFFYYLGFGQIMKNKKYFKSKSNPNLKNSINFESNHLKNVSNPNHFLKKPNPNQIQIQSNQIRKIMKNFYSKFCSLHIFWVRNDNCLIVYLSMIDNSSNKTK